MQTHGLINLLREEFESNGTSFRSSNCSSKAKQLFTQTMNALGITARSRVNSNTLLSARCEVDDGIARLLSCNKLTGDAQIPWHAQASMIQKMKHHDLHLQAAWNDKCVDRRGAYWNIPHAASVDLVSHGFSGIAYRVGLYHSSGISEDSTREGAGQLPLGALPGICGQAALYWEKKKEIWKDRRSQPHKPFNLLDSCPRVLLSGVIGGLVTAENLRGGDRQERLVLRDSFPRISTDLFTSAGISTQLGHFQRWFLDFSKLDAHLNIGSVNTLAMSLHNSNQLNKDFSNFPNVEVTFQQQVAGPFCARVDSRFMLDSTFKKRPSLQDLTYSFEWSPESFGALKVVAWYSPMRNEGMMEFRLLEK
ncbi:hypothetical protein KP509_39G037000 [Ceratopteris richardii]|nr:hypothetical protein KP509_39G037000 [Ceratopteris richardii]